jgi:DNA-binding transcriptional LysR family regulator
VDLAIFAAPTRNIALEYRQIDTLQVPLVIARDLVPGAAQDVTREDLARHPQVVVKSTDEKSPDTGLLNDAPKWFVTELGAKKDLICAGLGWGRLPYHLVADELAQGALVALPTLGEITLPICISRRSHTRLGPVGTHIWQFFAPRS